MKICFLYYSIFTLGGIQSCLTILSNYLVSKGYDVTIICSNRKQPVDRDIYGLDERVNIIFINEINVIKKLAHRLLEKIVNFVDKSNYLKNNEKILEFLCYSYCGKNLEKIIKENKFDIVISCGSYFNMLLSLLNIGDVKKIGWQHHCYERYFSNKYYKQEKLLKKMFTNLNKYMVLIDDDKKKIKTINGYESTRIYNPTRFIQENKSNLENKKFLSVGRLAKDKGFDILIKNFKEFNNKNKEWTLDIYGEGPEKENLLQMINNLELTQYVKIHNKTNEIKKVYREASIYCLTSRYEGLPMVILEAMETGLPVIAYNLPCICEVIRDKEGIIVPIGDDETYINSMLELANNKQKRQEISENAIKRAKDFYIEQIGPRWEKIFQDLMK